MKHDSTMFEELAEWVDNNESTVIAVFNSMGRALFVLFGGYFAFMALWCVSPMFAMIIILAAIWGVIEGGMNMVSEWWDGLFTW